MWSVLVLFCFVSFGRGCMNYMLPVSYAWGNFSVLAVGIWAIVQRDSLDAITMVSVRVLVSLRLLRKRVEGRVFGIVMIFSCSQHSSSLFGWVWIFFKRVYKSMSSVNNGEKHSHQLFFFSEMRHTWFFLFLPAAVTCNSRWGLKAFNMLELEGLCKTLFWTLNRLANQKKHF